MTRQRKPVWHYLFSIAVWAVLIAFVLRSVGRMPSLQDWTGFIEKGALPGATIFGLCFLFALAIRTMRFGFLIRYLGPMTWRSIVSAFPWLFMLGAVTPFRLGDLARADWVRKRGGSAAGTLGLWLAERATDMLILICFLAAGTAMAPAPALNSNVLWGLVVLIGCVYLVLWLAGEQLREAVGPLPGIGSKLVEVIDGFRYMRMTHLHLGIVGLSIVIWGTMVLGFWFGTNLTLGLNLPVGAAVLCVSTVNLAAIISAAPGNLGSFQAAFIASLSLYGVSATDALMASAVLQGMGLTITLVLGALSRMMMLAERPAT